MRDDKNPQSSVRVPGVTVSGGVLVFILTSVFLGILLGIAGWLTWYVWQLVVVPVFELPALNWWQATVLFVWLYLIFGRWEGASNNKK